MAMSAAFIRLVRSVPCSGASAIPIEPPIRIDCPAGLNGSARAARAPAAIRSASSRVETSGSSMVNSSPARRASSGGARVPSATSALRTTRSRLATITSTWSPWAWPRRSLTSLKPSRSMNRRAAPLSREARMRSASRRKWTRLGSEVTGSYIASAWASSRLERTWANRPSTAAASAGMSRLQRRRARARRDRRGSPRAGGRSARRRRGHGRCWAARRRDGRSSARTGR